MTPAFCYVHRTVRDIGHTARWQLLLRRQRLRRRIGDTGLVDRTLKRFYGKAIKRSLNADTPLLQLFKDSQ